MTWLNFMKQYDNSIDEKVADYLLFNETAFPFSDLKITTYQLRSAIRARKNNIQRCEICGQNLNFHKFNCLERFQ